MSTHETTTSAPEGLLDALDAYEAALAANDLEERHHLHRVEEVKAQELAGT